MSEGFSDTTTVALPLGIVALFARDFIKAWLERRGGGGDESAQLAAIRVDLSELKVDVKAILEKLSDHGEQLSSIQTWRQGMDTWRREIDAQRTGSRSRTSTPWPTKKGR